MPTKKQPPDFMVRSAPITPATINAEERSVEAVLSVEAPVSVYDYKSGRMIEEILIARGAEFGRTVPMPDSHDRYSVTSVLGSIRDIRADGDRLIGRAYFASDSKSVDAFTKYREGHLTDFSVGYRIDPNESVTVEPGETRAAFGREYTRAKTDAPLRVVNRWQLFEVSAVTVGADPAAKARSLEISLKEERKMDKELEKFLVGRGIDPAALDDGQRAAWAKIFEAETAIESERKAPAPVAPAAPIQVDFRAEAARAVRESIAAERAERAKVVEQIRAAVAGSVPADVAERFAAECDSVEAAKCRALDYLTEQRKSVGSPAIQVGMGRSDLTKDHLTARIMCRAGMEDAAVKDFGEQVVDQARKIAPDNLADLARACMAIDGINVPAGRTDALNQALTMCRASSTFTLPYVLGNVANKSMLRGYAEMPQTWDQFCSVVSVPDFKLQTAIGAGFSMTPELVGPDGKLKHGTMSDSAEQYRAYTYGKMFAVNYENFVNDDMGVFTEIPNKLGKGYRNYEADVIYGHILANGALADGYALCGTDHDNYTSGTDSALSSTYGINAISALVKKFMTMTDRDGHTISVMPKFLLVPPELDANAQEIFKASVLTGVSTTKSPNVNIHAGRYQVITEPRLSSTALTGYSTTAWYLLADPAAVESIRVAYVNGNRMPTIQQAEAPFDTLGYQWRVYGSFGVKAVDYRGIAKSAGA
jgi:hypothetical protein